MELILIGVFFALLVGVLATSLGRNGFGWFLLSLVITPILAGIILLIAGKADGRQASTSGKTSRCPECAERILKEARVCKHCGHRLLPSETEAQAKFREQTEADRLLVRRIIGFSLIAIIVYIGYTN